MRLRSRTKPLLTVTTPRQFRAGRRHQGGDGGLASTHVLLVAVLVNPIRWFTEEQGHETSQKQGSEQDPQDVVTMG